MKARRGPDHPDTLYALHNLAVSCSDAGRLDEAIPLFEEVVRLRKAKLGPDHPFTLASADGLAGACLDARRWSEAASAARECLEARTRKQPDDWQRFHTMSLLGTALAGRKQYAEAEPLLIGGYEGLKAREAAIPPPARGRLRRRGADRPVLRGPGRAGQGGRVAGETGRIGRGKAEALTPRAARPSTPGERAADRYPGMMEAPGPSRQGVYGRPCAAIAGHGAPRAGRNPQPVEKFRRPWGFRGRDGAL